MRQVLLEERELSLCVPKTQERQRHYKGARSRQPPYKTDRRLAGYGDATHRLVAG